MADDNHRDQVLSCLTEAGEPLTVRNITATTGLKGEDVKQALGLLQSEGLAETTKVGRSERWSPTTPEKAAQKSTDNDGEPGSGATTDEAATDPLDATGTTGVSDAVPAKSVEDDSEVGEAEAEQGPIDPELVFTATMLDQFTEVHGPFTFHWFASVCGKTTPTERTRLLRTLWALREHDLVGNSDPYDIEGGEWAALASGLAATVIARRLQTGDAPEEIEVRTIKRMPWANGGTKSPRGRGNSLKTARRRGELREQIDAVLATKSTGELVTPGDIAEEVRVADGLHREADANAVNNYLVELRLADRLTDASAESGGRAYRLI